MSLQIVILAAGCGKRMHSTLPKVLHQLAGKPLLEWVIDTAQALGPDTIHVVYGHGGEQLKKAFSSFDLNWVFQAEQLGTGHAVLQVLPHIPLSSNVLILSADVPLIQINTLNALLDYHNTGNRGYDLSLLVASLENPQGLGRIIRHPDGKIKAIVEEKDACSSQKKIQEIYSGICCIKANNLFRWLPKLNNNNAQREYYLTEIVNVATEEGADIGSFATENKLEIQGINNRLQLHQLERTWQKQEAERLLLEGITLADSTRFDLRGNLRCGKDIFIDVNTLFSGSVILETGCHIGAGCILHNVTIGAFTTIHPYSILQDCIIGEHCEIGPFARLRPGTMLAKHCKIGNFVETKNATLNEGTKANHLSYLGDTIIGKHVNVGAGTITCNYDGANKHSTIIEDNVFIGSDTQLVAPIKVGANATIGAGSTIRKNVPPGELTLTESKQKTIPGWKRPVKKL